MGRGVTWRGATRTATVYYYFEDHLGTSRVMVQAGQNTACYEADFYPFGGERLITNACSQNYKFTGKERDSETGNDYFGARFYASNLGRFLSPDPLLNSGQPWAPQSWNRYSYTVNNPLRYIDPTGLFTWRPSGCNYADTKCQEIYRENQEKFRQALRNLEKATDRYNLGSREYKRLEAAAKAYGKEGEETGVMVGFGSLTGDAAGGVTVSADEAGNLSFAVTFDMSKISGGDAFAIDTGHEGTHVADIRNPLYADPRTTLSDFQREFRGYETSVWVARSLGFATLSYGRVQVWNRSWSKVDQRDAAITRYLTTREQNPLPETRPHNPWPD